MSNDMLMRLAQMKSEAMEEGDRYLETNKRATYSLDNQIEQYKKYYDRNTENIEHAYSSIRSNLIAIRKWEIENESMGRFIALLEMFRTDLEDGVDVTDEYSEGVAETLFDTQDTLNLEPDEGTVENVIKEEQPKPRRRAAKPKGDK